MPCIEYYMQSTCTAFHIHNKYITVYSILMKMSTEHAFPRYLMEYYSFEKRARAREGEKKHLSTASFHALHEQNYETHTILNAAHFDLRVWMLHIVHTTHQYRIQTNDNCFYYDLFILSFYFVWNFL